MCRYDKILVNVAAQVIAGQMCVCVCVCVVRWSGVNIYQDFIITHYYIVYIISIIHNFRWHNL